MDSLYANIAYRFRFRISVAMQYLRIGMQTEKEKAAVDITQSIPNSFSL